MIYDHDEKIFITESRIIINNALLDLGIAIRDIESLDYALIEIGKLYKDTHKEENELF